jgi:hypothetical protein
MQNVSVQSVVFQRIGIKSRPVDNLLGGIYRALFANEPLYQFYRRINSRIHEKFPVAGIYYLRQTSPRKKINCIYLNGPSHAPR